MSTNTEIAQVFYAIADLLDLQGERFKPDAYRRAARSIESLGEDLRKVAQRGALDQIPGVGEALREKITEYLKDGKIAYYDRLREAFPPGVLELMRIPGIGPKTTGRFYLELRIDSPAALAQAIDGGRLNGLAGFGPKKIENLREALRTTVTSAPAARTPLWTAWRLARTVIEELSRRTPVHDIVAAGSLRRCRETVGDLDILATSDRPPETVAEFGRLPTVRSIVVQGDTKATVIHEPGIQVDLRVVEPASFGAALQYFTGSKDHNIHLRSLARDRGLKINEYGVFRGEARVAGTTEAEVYASMGLDWMPPEIRENQGEIEAAQEHRLPVLIDGPRLRGELHRHLPDDLDLSRLRPLVAEARRWGFGYLGFVIPASIRGRAAADRVAGLRRLWPETEPGRLQLLLGREVELGGEVPEASEEPSVEYRIAVPGPGTGVPRPPDQDPAVPLLFVGHLHWGPDGGDAPRESVAPWIPWCRAHGVALELTPAGASDGLDAAAARWVHEAGVNLVLSSGPDTLADLELTTGRARRGWVPVDRVLNSRDDALAQSGARPSGRRPRSAARK